MPRADRADGAARALARVRIRFRLAARENEVRSTRVRTRPRLSCRLGL
jgi:hypothetical protein